MALRLVTHGLRKAFNRRIVFENIDTSVSEGETLLIAGRNGSGKSTLVKILCDVLSPSQGSVDITGAGPLNAFTRKALFGLVSPYLQLYDEFSAMENLQLAAALRGLHGDARIHEELLARVALDPKRADPVHGFSSGMKQRLKYALALAHHPRILILDEPMSNLDADGMTIVRGIMTEQRTRGILVVATNDLSDIDVHERKVDLNVRA
jgi:heme exporter protein A